MWNNETDETEETRPVFVIFVRIVSPQSGGSLLRTLASSYIPCMNMLFTHNSKLVVVTILVIPVTHFQTRNFLVPLTNPPITSDRLRWLRSQPVKSSRTSMWSASTSKVWVMSENANLKRSAYLHTRMPWVHFWGQKSSEHFRKHMDQGKRANPWKTQVDGHKSTQGMMGSIRNIPGSMSSMI